MKWIPIFKAHLHGHYTRYCLRRKLRDFSLLLFSIAAQRKKMIQEKCCSLFYIIKCFFFVVCLLSSSFVKFKCVIWDSMPTRPTVYGNIKWRFLIYRRNIGFLYSYVDDLYFCSREIVYVWRKMWYNSFRYSSHNDELWIWKLFISDTYCITTRRTRLGQVGQVSVVCDL